MHSILMFFKTTFWIESKSVSNDCKGLGEFTEAGLENSNKYLRFYRQSLSRKTRQESNLEDCLTRLWIRSDPVVRASGPQGPICSRCSLEHYTVSCPEKAGETTSVASLDEFYLSCLIINWFFCIAHTLWFNSKCCFKEH